MQQLHHKRFTLVPEGSWQRNAQSSLMVANAGAQWVKGNEINNEMNKDYTNRPGKER